MTVASISVAILAQVGGTVRDTLDIYLSMYCNAVLTPVSAEHLRNMRYPEWSAMSDVAGVSIRWCGQCPAQQIIQCGEGCTPMPREWCGVCSPRVKNGCSPSCYLQRLLSPYHHRMFVARVVEVAPEAPCSWCGYGAGDWCESCDRELGPASAMCFRCEGYVKACRLCHAKNYVIGGGPIHRPADAARRYRGSGRWSIQSCGLCSVEGCWMKCSGCRVVSYCGQTCQASHWTIHKPVCRMLGGAIPVNFVYPWQRGAIETLRLWTVTEDAATSDRFQSCFGEGSYANE